ncbi:ORF7 [Kibale red-tailed guenon virus 1]|uniref:ORF7 n=1 Tax=Kibale red-tailed guenon virus 1 TaxID=1965065 RepID=L0CSF0_9NIDO|nr:ORF7 [Kibale red-tailed guenon virus 1]AGA19110.1 ORF7 [Kibale red-tailed guenon virus 1]
MKCLRSSAISLIGSVQPLSSFSLALLLLTCVGNCATESETELGGYSYNSTLWSNFRSYFISESYIVNISVCGALSIQNGTHWLPPVFNASNKNSTGEPGNNSHVLVVVRNYLKNYTGVNINHTTVVLETYLAYPIFTHLLSYYFATTAAFLDFTFFAGLGLTAIYYESPAFVVFLPLAAIFLGLFALRLTRNVMALRHAWTRHTNFIISEDGKLFVNHDDCLIEDRGGVRLGKQIVKVKKVILGGREAHLEKQAHVEDWSW